MSGLIAVLGGQEHHAGCEPIDRRLLAESGLSNPTVTVLLAATVPNRLGAKVLEATNYWPGLGARVRFSCPGGAHDTEHTLEALRDTDLVVLAGGRPWLMRSHLTSPIVQRLRRLSNEGVPLSGSSAGATALCAWRLHLQPGRTPRVERGLGFVPGFAAPHYGPSRHPARVAGHRAVPSAHGRPRSPGPHRPDRSRRPIPGHGHRQLHDPAGRHQPPLPQRCQRATAKHFVASSRG